MSTVLGEGCPLAFAPPMMLYSVAQMTDADAPAGIGTGSLEDLAALTRLASDLKRKADAATRSYDRTAWIRYAAIFVPIPFGVLLLRFHLGAWGYYLAGALFIVVALAVYVTDIVAVERRDRTVQAAQRAQAACAARMSAGRTD